MRFNHSCPSCGTKQTLPFIEGNNACRCEQCGIIFRVACRRFGAGKATLHRMLCSHCGKRFYGLIPNEPGVYNAKCPCCGESITYPIPSPEPPKPSKPEEKEPKKPGTVVNDEKVIEEVGCLVQSRLGGFWNKTYKLWLDNPAGTTITVGRKDEGELSDINIEGDDAVSCRSFSITIIRNEASGRLDYVMEVMHSANRLFVGGIERVVGNKFGLNDGDVVKMGRKTILTFKRGKVKQSE